MQALLSRVHFKLLHKQVPRVASLIVNAYKHVKYMEKAGSYLRQFEMYPLSIIN